MTRIPPDLLNAFDPVAGEGVVAFVGSGPSIASGLPSWPELLRHLADAFEAGEAIRPALDQGRYIDVAQYLVHRKNERAVQQKVVELFRERQAAPHEVYRRLMRLPFRGIVTTNYDTLLSDAGGDGRPPSLTYRTSDLRPFLGRPFIMHLHGHVHDVESIVLTRTAYDRYALGDARQARQFLNAVSIRHSLFFMGFGFQDANIDNVLRDMQDLGVISEWSVFALVPAVHPADPDPVLDVALRHRSINPIYVAASNDHGIAATCEWLAHLGECVQRMKEARLKPVVITLGPDLLARVAAVLGENAFHAPFVAALGLLPNRPDLTDPARFLLKTESGMLRIFHHVDVGELRALLMSLNAQRADVRLAQVLTHLPPAPAHPTRAPAFPPIPS